MSAIIEEAKRTALHNISGGGIASSFLWKGLVDRQLVRSNPWLQLFDSIILSNRTIRFGPRWCASRPRYEAIQCHGIRRYNAFNGSANKNMPNSFMKSELNIMHGERRWIRVIQHNTNDTKTREKPWYMPSGLAFSTECVSSKLPQGLLRTTWAWSADACGLLHRSWHMYGLGCLADGKTILDREYYVILCILCRFVHIG